MSAKPTPGPHRVDHGEIGWQVVDAAGRTVAVFPGSAWRQSDFTAEQAEANARAWVEGIAAMEKLKEIRRAIDKGPDADVALCSIVQILDEAKP